jgi:hypothetical protein
MRSSIWIILNHRRPNRLPKFENAVPLSLVAIDLAPWDGSIKGNTFAKLNAAWIARRLKGRGKKGQNQGNGAEGERPYPTNRKGLPTTPSDRLNHALVFPSQETTRDKLTMSSKAKNGIRTNGTSICNHTAGDTAPTEITGADLAAHSRLTTSISKALSRARQPIRRTCTAATRL